MPLPIDPSFAVSGADWQIAPVAPTAPPADGGANFSGALGKAIESLQADQAGADSAVQAMATGTVEDPTKAIMALERARLSMQLASQVRTKAVEAFQEIFHTQV